MSVITNNTIQPSSGQTLTIKDEGGTASITVATNGEATFAENIIVGTAGKGIDFQAQTIASVTGKTASTGTDEILDHYEVGNFSPTVSLTSGGTLSEQVGTYCRIGDFVSVHGRCRFNKSGGSGTLSSIGGLPFTSLSLSGYQSAGSTASVGVGKSGYVQNLRLDSGSASIAYNLRPQAGDTSTVSITTNEMSTNIYIRFSLQYRTA